MAKQKQKQRQQEMREQKQAQNIEAVKKGQGGVVRFNSPEARVFYSLCISIDRLARYSRDNIGFSSKDPDNKLSDFLKQILDESVDLNNILTDLNDYLGLKAHFVPRILEIDPDIKEKLKIPQYVIDKTKKSKEENTEQSTTKKKEENTEQSTTKKKEEKTKETKEK